MKHFLGSCMDNSEEVSQSTIQWHWLVDDMHIQICSFQSGVGCTEVDVIGFPLLKKQRVSMCPLQRIVNFGVCCSFLVLILISVERVVVCKQFLILIVLCLRVVNAWVQSHQYHLVLINSSFPFVAYQLCQIR